MNEDQIDEFHQMVTDVVKYSQIRIRQKIQFEREYQCVFQETEQNEPTAEQREEFYNKLNRPYCL